MINMHEISPASSPPLPPLPSSPPPTSFILLLLHSFFFFFLLLLLFLSLLLLLLLLFLLLLLLLLPPLPLSADLVRGRYLSTPPVFHVLPSHPHYLHIFPRNIHSSLPWPPTLSLTRQFHASLGPFLYVPNILPLPVQAQTISASPLEQCH